MPLESWTGGHGASKSSRDPKNVDYSHENGQKCPKSRVFTTPLEYCTGGHGASYPPGTKKTWTIADENVQKCPKSQVFTMLLESWTGGHGASKSSQDPKNVDYSPRKRPEMPEITSFHDAAGVVYRGSRGIEILPGPKKGGL